MGFLVPFLSLTSVLGLLNQKKLMEGQTRNSGKALLGPGCSSGEREQTTGALASSLMGGELAPYMGGG